MNRRFDRRLLGDIIKIFLIVAFFSFAAYLLDRPDIRKYFFDIDEIRSMFKGQGDRSLYIFSTATFALAGAGVIALGVPRLWVTAIAGGVYGALMGSTVSLLSSLLGSSIVYLSGKTLLAGVVERRLRGKARIWKERFQENAFWWVLFARLLPFSNSTFLSLLCGSCNAPFLQFFLGSLAGFIPLTLVFAIYGSGGAKGNIWQIAFATILLILSMFSRKLMKKWFRTKNVGDDIRSA